MFKSENLVVALLTVFLVLATSVRSANAADTVVSAKVLSATERVVQQCTQAQYQQQSQQESIGNSVVPALLGSTLGGILGNQIGGGQGRVIATTVGATTGAVMAAQYGRSSAAQQAPAQQQQCSYQTIGYEVTYDLNGVIGKGFIPYRPGSTVNVGLAVM